MAKIFWVYGTDIYRIPGYGGPHYQSYRRSPSWWGIQLTYAVLDVVADLIELRPRTGGFNEQPASNDRPWSYRASDELPDDEEWSDA